MTKQNDLYRKLITQAYSKPYNKYGNIKQPNHDSKLEAHFHNLLLNARIPHLQKKPLTLINPFSYGNEKIQATAIEPDFLIYNHLHEASEDPLINCIAIVDTKHITKIHHNKNGSTRPELGTPEWRIKIKLLKLILSNKNHIIPLFFPTNKTQCADTLIKLIQLRNHNLQRNST